MDSIPWSELQKIADEAGVGTELPDGQYEFKVVDTNVGNTQNGKPKIGVQLEVQVGPLAGKRVWDNLTLTIDNPKAVAIFVRKCRGYGATDEQFARNASLEEIAAGFLGVQGSGKIVHKDGYQNVNNWKRSSIPGFATPAAAVVGATIVPGSQTPVQIPSAPVPVPQTTSI